MSSEADTPDWAQDQIARLLPLANPDNPTVAVASFRGMIVGYGWSTSARDDALPKAIRYADDRGAPPDTVWVSGPACDACTEAANRRGIHIRHLNPETETP